MKPKSNKGKIQHQGSLDRDPIISCNAGKHAYVLMDDGTSPHFATDSDEFAAALKKVDGGLEMVFTLANHYPDSTWVQVAENLRTDA